jgi:hypothetical protein
VGLELTRAHLALAEAGAARTILTETERVLEVRPHMGSLIEDAHELRDRLAHNGHLTAKEYKQLNGELNRNNGRIFRDKHNGISR